MCRWTASLHASIEFESGAPPIDAFAVAEGAMKAWETHAFPIAGVQPCNQPDLREKPRRPVISRLNFT